MIGWSCDLEPIPLGDVQSSGQSTRLITAVQTEMQLILTPNVTHATNAVPTKPFGCPSVGAQGL
jgi:hypothetical protein